MLVSDSSILFYGMATLSLAIVSYFWQIKQCQNIVWSVMRSLLQLLLIGYVLQYIFLWNIYWVNLLIIFFMTIISVLTIQSRLKIRNFYTKLFLMTSLVFSAWPLTMILIWIVHDGINLNANILIPLAGIMLGNSLNAITLGVQRVQEDMHDKKYQVLTFLGLGASWKESTHDILISSLRSSLTPILNSMLVVGIVRFPGLMTGKILAGEDPLSAAKYQFIILCSLLLTIFCASSIGIYWQLRWFFTDKNYLKEKWEK